MPTLSSMIRQRVKRTDLRLKVERFQCRQKRVWNVIAHACGWVFVKPGYIEPMGPVGL